MSNDSKRVFYAVVGVATLGCCLFLNDDLTSTGPLVKQAQAYIGNPLTPMSYAGVARRTTRRAYYGAAAYGAAAYPPPPAYAAPAPAYGYPPPPGYAPPPGYPYRY